jgi:hypothetical protein
VPCCLIGQLSRDRPTTAPVGNVNLIRAVGNLSEVLEPSAPRILAKSFFGKKLKGGRLEIPVSRCVILYGGDSPCLVLPLRASSRCTEILTCLERMARRRSRLSGLLSGPSFCRKGQVSCARMFGCSSDPSCLTPVAPSVRFEQCCSSICATTTRSSLPSASGRRRWRRRGLHQARTSKGHSARALLPLARES